MYGCTSFSPGSEGPPVVICTVGITFSVCLVLLLLLFTYYKNILQYTVHTPVWGKNPTLSSYDYGKPSLIMTMENKFNIDAHHFGF